MDPVFIVIMVALFGLLLFMMSKNRKRMREAEEMRNSLDVGDEVMTTSGLYGVITAIEGNVVTVESTPGVPTRWFRPAISRKVDPETEYAVAADDAVVTTEAAEPAEETSGGESTTAGFLSEDQVRRPYREDKKD